MSVKCVQATKAMVYYVSFHMRDRDYEEINETSWTNSREDLASDMATRYGDLPMTLCITKDDEPVCIFAGVNHHPGVWSVGLWATDKMPKIGKFLTKTMVPKIFDSMRFVGAHRVECRSIVGYTEIHKWLRFIGFKETGIDKAYGKSGTDFIVFSWTEGMPFPRGYIAE